jgi:beta-glucosidase
MDYNIRHGRTYLYFKGKPLYPFGYGLSYTTFQYSRLRMSAPILKKRGEVLVVVDVTNTGTRDGDEVVQVYVRFPGSKVERPLKELAAFQRVKIPHGRTQTVQVFVGGSSADERLSKSIPVVE